VSGRLVSGGERQDAAVRPRSNRVETG
jgi:hypothetical protein